MLAETREFYSVPDILDYAYRMEAQRIAPSMMTELVARGTNPSELDQQETIADGYMQKNRADRNLPIWERRVVAAHYKYPYIFMGDISNKADATLFNEHEKVIMVLASYIQHANSNIRDKYFVQDIIREWSLRGKPHHDIEWWSQHLQRPQGTLKMWAYSRNPARKSIKYTLDQWLSQAEYKLSFVFDDLLCN